MTPGPARTDEREAIAAPEFVWQSAGALESHAYLVRPVAKLLREAGARRVLDLGCGNGAFSASLAAHGFEMSGLDHSASGIAVAQRSFPAIAFGRHDLAEPLPAEFAGRFDAVVAVEVIEHLLLPRRLIAAAVRALRPGGRLVITTPYHGYVKNLALALCGRFDEHWHPLRDYGHIKFFSRRTLLALLGEFGLRRVELRTAGRIPLLAKSMIAAARAP